MQIISATKTAKETILNRKKNLFGLGLTSLIAACGTDKAAGGGAAGDDGGNENPPVGDIGDRPANPVPDKLSATGELAEDSSERLAPVAVDSGHISASPIASSDRMNSADNSALNDLKVTIDVASGLVDNNVEITFKNGDHDTADPFASVYQLADAEAGKHDLVVASADFGYPDGGAIYFFWDIGSRDTTTFDSADDTNFLRILGDPDAPIGKYAPNFFHIGGNDAQYDMILGANQTLNNPQGAIKISHIYIVWDVTKYAGTSNQNLSLVNDISTKTTITSHNKIYMNEYAPEFFHLDSNEYHDMVIRGVGEGTVDDRIYIVWDVADPALNQATINLGTYTGSAKTLNIYNEFGNKIASYAPEFSHIGGDDDDGARYDMVIRSDVDAGKIYILWDVNKYSASSDTIVLSAGEGQLNVAKYGLLRIFGEAGKKIDKYSPEFLQIGGTDTQNDMIIKSNDDTTIYILWDVAAYYDNTDATTLATPVDVDLSNGTTITNGLLKITGENIGKYSPEFLQIAGTTTQEDMVIRSDTAIYVLWDVAEYYSTDTTPINLSTNDGITKGLLKITGTTASEKIGQSAPDILKINNNDDYDMIIKSDANMYVLWDFTKDYSATTPAEISLTDASATNGNGLLTISGANAADVLKKDDGSFDDIDSNGINDIVFTDGGNTFILFGEQLAYRDVDGKAVSHEVDLTGIDFGGGSAGFFTADAVVTPTTKADLEDAIGYRFADTETDIGTVKTDYEALFNSIPSAELSGADAGAGVWDIV